jgi:hypothetical protein
MGRRIDENTELAASNRDLAAAYPNYLAACGLLIELETYNISIIPTV